MLFEREFIDERKLEEILAETGASKLALAKAADLNPNTLSRVKNGKVLGPKSSRKILSVVQAFRAQKTAVQAS